MNTRLFGIRTPERRNAKRIIRKWRRERERFSSSRVSNKVIRGTQSVVARLAELSETRDTLQWLIRESAVAASKKHGKNN